MTTALETLAAAAQTAPANREEWLQRLADALRSDFAEIGYELPERVRYSCGWTSTGRRSTRVGEHWGPGQSADGTHEIFITPRLSDAAEVAATLVHELVHAAVHPVIGHGVEFRRCAVLIGLTGHMRRTHATVQLRDRLAILIAELGDYPHGVLSTTNRPSTPVQRNRQILVWCSICGYRCRSTRAWLDLGTPLCPMGHGAMIRQDTGRRVTVTVTAPTVDTPTVQIDRQSVVVPELADLGDLAEMTAAQIQDASRPTLVDAPFTAEQWILRAVEAYGGENVDTNDVETLILVEATNSDLTADVATPTVRSDGTVYAYGAGRRQAVRRPGRMVIAAAMRDLTARGFLVNPTINGDVDATLHCLTDKGRTEDPNADADATPEQHAAQVARRGNRFAAAFAENLIDAPLTEQASPQQRAGTSARHAALDMNDAPAAADDTAAAAPAPRSNRFAKLDL